MQNSHLITPLVAQLVYPAVRLVRTFLLIVPLAAVVILRFYLQVKVIKQITKATGTWKRQAN